MKTLNLHCEYIRYKSLKKAIKTIDEIAGEQEHEGYAQECLVVLMSVEKADSKTKTVDELVKSIKDIAAQVKTENIVLYPYAHLSKNLGSPQLAIDIVNNTEEKLKDLFNVKKAPFGYYKEFELKVKGHPLSELSREFVIEGNEEVVELSEKERKLLLKKLTKVKMQAPKGEEDKKSNVELGRDLDLYIVNDVIGQGLPLLTSKGASIKREIERFITDEELKRGYEHTSTPVMAKSDLYKISGHWQHYKEDMFVLKVHGEDYALRPMTCPFQFALYKRKPRSHKDLPKRYAEVATLFRNEKSGELRGLTRVRQFTLSDAHILCTPEQVKEEFKSVVDLVKYVMETFGIEIWYRFSRWDPESTKEKYVDNPKAWEETENSMKNILDSLGINYTEAKGEAAFYGPKLDLQYKDVYGKEDTLITVQIDFAGAGNFNLNYLDKDGTEKPVTIIHRSSTGATERVISYLLEKTQGNLPLWLSPTQVRVLPMNDECLEYAKEVKQQLLSIGIRTEVETSNESIGKKVRAAITDKVFYIATVGDKEKSSNGIAVRTRTSRDIEELSLEEFKTKLQHEIKSHKK